MRRLIQTRNALALIALAAVGAASSQSARKADAPVRMPRSAAGTVSRDGVITFEETQRLNPSVKRATVLLRSGKYADAIDEFRRAQAGDPSDPLALLGEIQASVRLDSERESFRTWEEVKRSAASLGPALGRTIERLGRMLASAGDDPRRRATLHYAYGYGILVSRAGRGWLGEPRLDLGPEPRRHLQEALRLDPELMIAHLALAIYYEHQQYPSGCKGSLARKHYDAALALRPDLACKIRFLHAMTWDRPGIAAPAELAREARIGLKLTEDDRRMPGRAIAECKALIRDFPDFAPAYDAIAVDYAILGRQTAARKYRSLAAAARARASAPK